MKKQNLDMQIFLMGMAILTTSLRLQSQTPNLVTSYGTGAGTGSVGFSNTFTGAWSGYSNTTGDSNTFAGVFSGLYNTTGTSNTLIGSFSGYFNQEGSYNTYLGAYSGLNNISGSGNVFIGHQAGYHEKGSNKLCIANSNGFNHLIYGDFALDSVAINGLLYAEREINAEKTETAGLSSNSITTGKIQTKNLIVAVDEVADYVFEDSYELRPLEEVEGFVTENKHLPGIPSGNELKEKGMDVAEMNNLLLEKIEELTLYIIAQEKRMAEQDNRMDEQDKMIIERNKKMTEQDKRIKELENKK